MAAYANDTSLVSVRLIVGDEEEAALLLSSALNYSGGKELPLSSQLNSTGSLVPALIRGDQVASASSGPCSVPSAALDVQVIALAHAAAPFGGLGGFHYDPSSRACDNGQIRWGARPGCRPDGHKFLYQFVKKIVAARYFVSARGLLILDSESEALPRPFSMGALYREYQHRPYAFLTHRPVEHCTCAAMLGGIHVDPMASAPRDVPNESCAGHAAAGLAPPVWGAGRCVQGSLVQAEATGDVGIRTPWGYGGWFWAHAEVEALVQHVEQLHRGSFVSIAASYFYREPIMEPHALQHCAWSREESAGFFCYPDHEWRLKRRIFVEALRQSAVDEHPISNMFWQNNWEPNFACAFERRPGAPGDGAKWLCDPHKLTQRHGHGHAARRSGGVAVGGTGSVDDDEATAPGAPPNTGCLLYSIGSAGNFAWELSMLELLRVCEVHTFDHTMRLGSVHPPPGVTYHYWGVGTADRWIRADKSVGVFTLNTMREMLGHANRTVDVLKVDVEGAEYGFLLPLLERDGGRGLAFAQQLLIELHYERISSHYPPRGPFLKLHSGDAAPRGDSPHVVQPPPMHHRFFWAMTRAGWAIFHKEPNTAYAMGGCLEYGFVRLDWNASALIEEAKQWWCVGGWRNEENGFLPRCQGWGSLPPGAPTTLRHLGYVSNENYGRGGQPAANVLLERDNVTGGFVLAPGQQLTAHGKGWRAHHHPAP